MLEKWHSTENSQILPELGTVIYYRGKEYKLLINW